jgi:hypothetical protein
MEVSENGHAVFQAHPPHLAHGDSLVDLTGMARDRSADLHACFLCCLRQRTQMNEKGAIRDLNFLEEIRADFVSCHRFKMTPLLVCGVCGYCLSFTQKQRQVGFVIRFVDANPHRRPRFAVQKYCAPQC